MVRRLTSHISARPDRWIALALGALVLLVAVPGALMGTGWFREDWSELERLRHCGFVECPGPEIGNRPVMELLWAAQFGAFDNHPTAIYWLLNISLAVTGASLYLILRHFLGRLPAGAVVVLWAVLPTHTALQHWASVMHNVLALMLVTLGALRLLRRPDWLAIVCFALSISIYESTAPLAILTVLALPWLPTRSTTRRFRFASVSVLGVLTAVILAVQVSRRARDLVQPTDILWSNFAFATRDRPLYQLVSLLAALGIGVAVARLTLPSFRHRAGPAERLVGIGLLVMAIGALPFMTTDFDSMFVRLGDRANQICAIGSAMVWVGVLQMLRRRAALIIGVAVLLIIGTPLLLERDRSYAYVAIETPRAVRAVQAAAEPASTQVTITLRHDPRYADVSTSLEQEVRLAAAADRHHPLLVHFVEPGKSVPDPLAAPGRW